jgi:hypothetical protein
MREAIERREAKRERARADGQARRQLRRERRGREPEREVEPALQLQPYVIDGAHGDPLAVFREALALARRAGMPWEQAVAPSRIVALAVESDDGERAQWAVALGATQSAWRAAYEREPTSCAL